MRNRIKIRILVWSSEGYPFTIRNINELKSRLEEIGIKPISINDLNATAYDLILKKKDLQYLLITGKLVKAIIKNADTWLTMSESIYWWRE